MKDLQAELDSYIGLAAVKRGGPQPHQHGCRSTSCASEHDLPTTDMSLHMVFSGNPGTGKTTDGPA